MAVWKNTYQPLNGLRFVPFQNSPKSEESSSVRCHRDSDTFIVFHGGPTLNKNASFAVPRRLICVKLRIVYKHCSDRRTAMPTLALTC